MRRIIGGAVVFMFSACSVNKIQPGAEIATTLQPFSYTVNKKVTCDSGAVVSAHPLASAAGLDVLRSGGNAFDAAITTQLVLAVVYPGAGNIGGGGFLVGRKQDGKNVTIDFREKAPARATRDMFLDKNGKIVNGLSTSGPMAAGVPGTVAGLFATLKYGNKPFSELIQPAIDLAESGFTITASEAVALNAHRVEFLRTNTVLPVFVKDRPWQKGDTLRQKDLAQTLIRIRDKGMYGFYRGETADLIVKEMSIGRGIISHADLRKYSAKERQPLVFGYKGFTMITMPLPSGGGIILNQLLKMVEDKPLKEYGFQSCQAVQLMTEVSRRAYADRAVHLGDADFYKAPVKTLVSETYLLNRLKDYDPARAGISEKVQAGLIAESEETTHLSIYDQHGNAVAVTTTLNGSYGCGTVVGGAGFLLNNEMDDFSAKPGTMNMYGAVGGQANAIQPGKRMLSSMTPTIALKGGKPFLVLGTPGGTTIPTSVFQTLVNIIEFDMSLDKAINAPKFHHQWMPDVIYTEPSFDAGAKKKLEQIGYKLSTRSEIGRTDAIMISDKGQIEAVGDSRGDDHAAGY